MGQTTGADRHEMRPDQVLQCCSEIAAALRAASTHAGALRSLNLDPGAFARIGAGVAQATDQVRADLDQTLRSLLEMFSAFNDDVAASVSATVAQDDRARARIEGRDAGTGR